uniref:phosphodiester glycosidase family protein n=1 Tax=Paenibacillus cymbidii TaxID=1639034 RepID=UPI001080C726
MNRIISRAGIHPAGWSWFKWLLMAISLLTFGVSSYMFVTPAGAKAREFLAGTVISTQHREWAWMFVGKSHREEMVQHVQEIVAENGEQPQQFNLIQIVRKNRTAEELIQVKDIEGARWKGKMMYVFDPTSIRLVVPKKPIDENHQLGERITEMVKRTGAIAGVNAGGFDDPDGLGNGFAPIGMLMSDTQILFGAESGKQPIVGFTDTGYLIVGNYTLGELREMKVKEAASFYPRVILDGKPLPVPTDIQPRTAVGQKADGTVIFIVIDGRQFGYSIGATMKEVQDLFLAEGVINAGFLDGGASSELVVNGQLMTKPSSRYGERRLPSAFLVFDHPEDYVVVNPWEDIKKIDAGGARSHPEFLAEQQRLRELGITPTPAATPKPSTTPTPEGSPSGSPSGSPGAGAGASGSPSGSPGAGGTTPKPSGSPGSSPGAGSGATATPSGQPSGSPGTGAGASATPGGSPGASGATVAPGGSPGGGAAATPGGSQGAGGTTPKPGAT